MQETRQRGSNFALDDWQVVPGENRALFRFECDVFGQFEESVSFPGPAGSLAAYAGGAGAGLLRLLHIALGVSTYKLAAAPRITLPELTPGGRAMAEALYTDGLAEFFVRNALPYPPTLEFDGPVTAPTAQGEAPDHGPALVAFGGGKDSYVARALLQAAGEDVQLASVVLGDAVRSTLTATAPDEVLFIDRRLDPKLLKVAPSAFQGHVPITAINMMVLAITAALNGQTQVIFANERSADEPTIDLGDGAAANHQYSKSSAFEELIRTALTEVHETPPSVYSVLRPYSELWIGRAFASLKEPFGRFTSCNRNFRIAGDADKRWCGACPKCAFTSLILSPFISAEEAHQIFGDVFLNREALQPFYAELLGLSDQKPWECVGTISECRAALWGAAKGAFADSAAVRTFLPKIREQMSDGDLTAAWNAALLPQGPHAVPPAYLQAAEGLEP